MVSAIAASFPSFGFEVISADSRQVYRDFDIGTAKPDAAVLEQVPHHLIDVIGGRESFDVGSFVNACDQLVPEIQRRGSVPIISGGTAFYLQSYLVGLSDTPRSTRRFGPLWRMSLHRDGLPAFAPGCAPLIRPRKSGSPPTTRTEWFARWKCTASLDDRCRRFPFRTRCGRGSPVWLSDSTANGANCTDVSTFGSTGNDDGRVGRRSGATSRVGLQR